MGLPEVGLGVLPGTGGTQRLTRALGTTRALELMVKGQNFDFERAHELGLVNELFEPEGFTEAVKEYARGFCPPGKASRAVGHIKRAVLSGAALPLESGLALERELQARLFSSEDCAEGLAAFIEKRTPEFGGR